MANDEVPAALVNATVVGDTTKDGVLPAWLIVTVFVSAPAPLMIIVVERGVSVVFAVHTTVIVPALLPLSGLTLSQLTDSTTLQLIFEAIVNVAFPPVDVKSNTVGETEIDEAAAC